MEKLSDDQKKRISEALKKAYASGKRGPPWNKGLNAEQDYRLKKISDSLKGKPPAQKSAEGRKRLSDYMKERVRISRMREVLTKPKYTQLTRGMLYHLYWEEELTLQDIATKFNISSSTIASYFKRFGIPMRTISEASKLTHIKGRNKGEFRKGFIPWNYGLSPTDETKQKIREARARQVITEEIRKKMSLNNARYWKGKVKSERHLRKIMSAWNIKPNKVEQRLIDIIHKYSLPFKYVGDGKVILGGLNPDFINTDGSKQLVEIFGRAFHDPKFPRRVRIPSIAGQESYRKAVYASLGFDCLVMWDDEMKQLSDREIANRIRRFIKSKKRPIAQLRWEF